MSEFEVAYHKRWLGMLEPIEGLVVSVPVLVEAECMEKRDADLSRQLAQEAKRADESQRLGDEATALTRVIGKTAAGHLRREIVSLDDFLSRVLGLTPELFARGAELPADLELYVPEGGETIRPTLALKKRDGAAAAAAAEASEGVPDVSTPQSRAGEGFVMLVSDQPGVDLDTVDRREGSWAHPPLAKFDRLLRATRVPIGLITNREELRLVYAPHGESSGVLTFRVGDLAAFGGRDILDAFVMLLSKQRFFVVDKERQLPALLRKSRAHQANVTTELADQVFDALTLLLRGFERAAERDGVGLLEQPLTRGGDYVYGGLLTVLLRLVFLLYAEDRDLLPTKQAPYATDLSLLSLFGQLQADHAAYPDTMARRFGAWPRLLAVFRAVYFGARWGTVVMPPRRGELFDPTRYPFLEGWGPDGGAPRSTKERALLRVPTIDDETIYRVLDKLLVLDGQRLSYRALDVEQIGSVYEGLIGYSVVRLDGPAVCLKPERVWVSASKCRAEAANRRAAWLQETAGVAKKRATQLASELSKCKTDEGALEVFSSERVKGSEPKAAGEYVLQPGAERRRTSSHYTPKSLTAPIVKKTLEPLLRALGDAPASDQLLALKICDPAMGSGAFLVETCRFLADQLVAAWSREGTLEALRGKTDDVVLHARRVVAQRCLYGVDRNPFAVTLARLSMWLVTLAKDAPFTFVDHALRHGDSLVGLTLEQLRAFHWSPPAQLELTSIATEVDAALEEARGYRERILALAEAGPEATEEKERLLRDAELALERARIVGDLVIGAYFAHSTDKDRERARAERLNAVKTWLDGEGEMPEPLAALREAGLRDAEGRWVQRFHWSIEFPEVFYPGRPDPLDRGKTGAACMDAFMGNPPFLGGGGVSGRFGHSYRDWLPVVHPSAHGNSDLSAHFFRRCWLLIGQSGALGLIASNTIAQGDTRASGLLWLANQGAELYDASTNLSWKKLVPNSGANVSVSVVHLVKGQVASSIKRKALNGRFVERINSRLLAGEERSDPKPLASNEGRCFPGSKTYSGGFEVSTTRRDALVRQRARNADLTFPYVGGDEINASPTQAFGGYVINFGTMPLQAAEAWPDLLDVVRNDVKPGRDALPDTPQNRRLKEYWWQYERVRADLYSAVAPLKQCLVNSRYAKHLAYVFQPTARVFSDTVYVYPFVDYARFAVLQSRMHDRWARLLSSSLEDRLRYAASDCFETFPFPKDETLTATSAVERAGQALYETRARFMLDTNQGLTKTYNALKDPENNAAPIVELRRLHESMDRAVLDAYGWTIIEVPPYGTPVTADERRALERFEDEVIDRLFALNAERAEDERRRGIAKSPAASALAAANDTEADEDADAGAEDGPATKAPKSAPRGKAAKSPGPKKTGVPSPKPKRTGAGKR
jgi:hypothetical protein